MNEEISGDRENHPEENGLQSWSAAEPESTTPPRPKKQRKWVGPLIVVLVLLYPASKLLSYFVDLPTKRFEVSAKIKQSYPNFTIENLIYSPMEFSGLPGEGGADARYSFQLRYNNNPKFHVRNSLEVGLGKLEPVEFLTITDPDSLINAIADSAGDFYVWPDEKISPYSKAIDVKWLDDTKEDLYFRANYFKAGNDLNDYYFYYQKDGDAAFSSGNKMLLYHDVKNHKWVVLDKAFSKNARKVSDDEVKTIINQTIPSDEVADNNGNSISIRVEGDVNNLKNPVKLVGVAKSTKNISYIQFVYFDNTTQTAITDDGPSKNIVNFYGNFQFQKGWYSIRVRMLDSSQNEIKLPREPKIHFEFK